MKNYYIDTENVCNRWLDLVENLEPNDVMYVFTSQKMHKFGTDELVRLLHSDGIITYIETCCGNNAMDFQICTQLGYNVAFTPNAEFIIVSNDRGYDAVVTYWRKCNVKIKRMSLNLSASTDSVTGETEDSVPCAGIYGEANVEGIVAEPEGVSMLQTLDLNGESMRGESYAETELPTSGLKSLSQIMTYMVDANTGDVEVPVSVRQSVSHLVTKSLALPKTQRLEYCSKGLKGKHPELFETYWNVLGPHVAYLVH